MIEIIIALLLFSTGFQAQKKYEHCRDIEFKSEYCEFEKLVDSKRIK